MKAIILAAGLGSRLMPETKDKPKCLVEIDGESLLQTQIRVLKSRGISEIAIVGGHCADQLENFSDELIVNEEYKTSNMVWSLTRAMDEISGEVIITYGDIVYSGQILDAILADESSIRVALDLDWLQYWQQRFADPISDAESLRVNKNMEITEIGNKPTSADEVEAQYMGLIGLSKEGSGIFQKNLLNPSLSTDNGQKSPKTAYITDFLQSLLISGHELKGVGVRDNWIEVDTVKDLTASLSRTRLRAIRRSL
jgi:choline kinase